MTRRFQVLFVGAAILVAPTARAALVTTTFCMEQSTAFADASTGDRLTTSSLPAEGVHFEVYQETAPAGTVVDIFLSTSVASPGCVTLDGSLGWTPKLDSAKSYTIKLHRDAWINGNSIVVNNSTGGTFTGIAKTGLFPTAGHTYSYANGDFWARFPSTDPQMILVAATQALKYHNAGLGGESFTFRDATCPGGGSCFDDSTEISWIGNPDRKFQTAYMMGLAVGNFANGHDDVVTDNSAALGACVPGEIAAGGTKMNTKEYTSEAAYRGLGLVYAAAAFNIDGSDDDCDFETAGDVDWSANGTNTDVDEDNIFSCDTSPAPGLFIPDADYYSAKCYSCAGADYNRGVAYDWMKAYWNFLTDSTYGGYALSTIADAWNNADPDTWTTNGSTSLSGANDPENRLSVEADAITGNIDWDNNGSIFGIR